MVAQGSRIEEADEARKTEVSEIPKTQGLVAKDTQMIRHLDFDRETVLGVTPEVVTITMMSMGGAVPVTVKVVGSKVVEIAQEQDRAWVS